MCSLVLGVTGGVATGKSTVLSLLQRLGARVFSADEIAREITQPGTPLFEQIVRVFGPSYLKPDGTLDRAKLAERIFQNPEDRRRLEALTHPEIIRRLRARIEEARNQPSSEREVIAVEIPLLFEAGLEQLVDRILVVASEQEQQIQRLKKRMDWPEEMLQKVISAQWPLEEKKARADWVIDNNGSLAEVEEQVTRLWEQVLRQRKEVGQCGQ